MVVAKPVTKKKFVQIREKQRTSGAKLSFKLSAHPSVFNVLSVNFTIIRIYKVMLYYSTHRISIYVYIWLHYLVILYKLIWDAIVEDYPIFNIFINAASAWTLNFQSIELQLAT